MTRRLAINGRFLLQPVTGVQKVAIEFCQALDRLIVSGGIEAWHVRVVAPAHGKLVTEPQFSALTLQRGGALQGHAWEQLELDGLAGEDDLLCLGNLAPVRRLLTRRRTVTMVHDLSYRYFPQAYSEGFRLLYGSVMPIVLRRSSPIVTVSQSEKDSMLREYGRLIDPERICVAPNGSTTGDGGGTEAPRPVSERSRTVLYVGSLTRRKNAARLIEACVRLAQAHADLRFAFIGGTADSFARVDVGLPSSVADRFQFLGQVNDPEQVRAAYADAALLLFPSLYESSGLPTTEAMAAGCPVVCSDIPALRERCGDAALFCDPLDVGSITERARQLLDDPTLWAEMQHRGLARATGFTWEAQVRTVLGCMSNGRDHRAGRAEQPVT